MARQRLGAQLLSIPLRMDFDMEMNVVADEVGAEEAEEFAGAVVAAVGGAVEFELAPVGEALAVPGRGDEHGEFQRAADAPVREGAAQEMGSASWRCRCAMSKALSAGSAWFSQAMLSLAMVQRVLVSQLWRTTMLPEASRTVSRW